MHSAFFMPLLTRSVHCPPAARFLTLGDLPELLSLEAEKWNEQQAASREDFIERIGSFPDLCVGAFCPHTGRIVASLFMKPVSPDFWAHARTWKDCAACAAPVRTTALFGISLSSRHVSGVHALLGFFWPHALTRGWRHIYLGSPVPGWCNWREKHPHRDIAEYVGQTRADGMPRDPQLRYYFSHGFDQIVCVKRGYFPHEKSQDHGVILRGTVPLTQLSPLWQTLPAALTRGITRQLSSLVF
jgi:hypothetical protein